MQDCIRNIRIFGQPHVYQTSKLEKMAQLDNPFGVFVSNGEVFIADTLNQRVRKLLRNGQIVTIAGNGSMGYDGDGQLATDAQLDFPAQVVVSSSDQVYISSGNSIRKIDRNGMMSTIAGTGEAGYNGDDQLAIHAKMSPCGLFVTEDEEILIVDNDNHRIRKIDRNGMITTIAGNGIKGFNGDGQLATTAQLSHPVSVFQYKNEIYISDFGNHRIRKIDTSGIISTIAGPDIITNPDAIFVHNDEVYFLQCKRLCKLQCNGIMKTLSESEVLNCPNGIFVDNDSHIYIADTFNHCIRRIDQDGVSSIVGTMGEQGYSGDVPFDFKQYPHIGPRKKSKIKPFPKVYHDLIVICD